MTVDGLGEPSGSGGCRVAASKNGWGASNVTGFAQSSAAVGFSRNRLPAAAIALVVVAVLVGVPVATTVFLGARPYEEIARVFPGNGVAVTAAVLRMVSDAAAVVSVGALVILLFVRDGSAKQVKTLEPNFDLAVLRVASRMWMLSSLGLMLFDPLDTSGVALS